jgi:hypothetical protein
MNWGCVLLEHGNVLQLLCKGVCPCCNNDLSFSFFVTYLLFHISSVLFSDSLLLQVRYLSQFQQLDFPLCNFNWLAFIHGSEILTGNGKLFFSLPRCICKLHL